MVKKKGFTLVELLAVIVIIGVLSTIAVYATGRIQDRMKKHYYDSQLSLIIISGKDYLLLIELYFLLT